MSFHVVAVRIHRHRRGLRHVHHRLGPSDLPRHLHGIQREPTDPQPHPGRPQLSRDAGHVRGAAGGEIQLSHQRGKRLRQQLPGLYYMVEVRGGSEHVGCNHICAVQLCRPPAHRGREYSPTSPTSSQSTSAGWSGHMTPPWAPSPTTQSSSTSTRVLTPWSISSTTPSWTCKCEWRHMTSAGLSNATASLPPLRSSSSIAVTDKNGSFISTLSMSLYQVPASSRRCTSLPCGVIYV